MNLKDIGLQVRRGLRSKGCLFSVCLMLYSLFFVHTDTPVFFRMPLTYFGEDSTFYYHFMISFWLGLSRYVIPIVAMLPLAFFHCDDQISGFINLSEYRLSRSRYFTHRMVATVISAMIVVAISCILFTLFLLCVCTLQGGEQEEWLLYRQGSAYEWVATVEHFHWFILFQYGRLMVSAATWALVAVTFSLLWANKAFVFVSTFGLSIFLDVELEHFLGEEYTIAFLQNPDFNTKTPLMGLFGRQMLFLGIAMVFCFMTIFLFSSKKIIKLKQKLALFFAMNIPKRDRKNEWNLSNRSCGTFLGEVLTDIRVFTSYATIMPAILIPVLVTICKSVFYIVPHSVGDLWLDTFGGFYWFEPMVNFTPIGLWILLLLPPMMGVALSLERELSTRAQLTLFRFRNKERWWGSKCIAILAYSIMSCVVMFFSVAVLGWLTGASGFGVLMEDEDGFLTSNWLVLLQTFGLFTGQIIMLTQIQALIHMLTGRMQLGIIAYILPCLACLITCSIFDRLGNVYVPYNWGMILRSSLFSPTFDYEESGEISPLCATNANAAMVAEIGVSVLLAGTSMLVARKVKISEREVKE